MVRSRPLAKRCSPNDPRTPLLFLLSIPPLVLTRFSIELIHIFLFQSVSSKVLGQTLHSFSYNFVFPQQLTNHPSQIWRSDPSRGYTWLALSNDSTCSHQLDTHSAGEIFKGRSSEDAKGLFHVWGTGASWIGEGFESSLGILKQTIIVSCVNTGPEQQ